MAAPGVLLVETVQILTQQALVNWQPELQGFERVT
jgi:hypothetical protein